MVPSVNNNNNNNNNRLSANGAHAHVMERRQAPPQIAHHGALAAIAVVGGVVAGLVGRVGGLLGSALRDGRQSGARPKVMRSNAGHNCATMWQVLSHMPYNQTKACRVAVIL